MKSWELIGWAGIFAGLVIVGIVLAGVGLIVRALWRVGGKG